MTDNVEILCLKQQVKQLRITVKFLSDWHDTMHSPWYKRLLWWVMGYRLLSLGTWYNASWNRDGQEYN